MTVDSKADDLDSCADLDQECQPEGPEAGGQEIIPAALPPVPVALHEPDAFMVACQVGLSVNVPQGTAPEHAALLQDGAIALYVSMEPRDAFESLLARLAVGLGNAAMDCLGRSAASVHSLKARDLDLRHATRAGLAVNEILKTLRHNRDQDHQKVTVGAVTVQAGGQAIVGNVGSRERREQTQEAAPDPKPIKGQEG